MNFRIHIWGNLENPDKPAFGVQRQPRPRAQFINLCATIKGVNRALIYTTRERAESVIADLQALKKPDFETGLVPLKS